MKTERIRVANMKCGGCATTIKEKLMAIEGVNTVDVDLEGDAVTVDCEESTKREDLVDKLYSIGYPEATKENGLLLQLKSFGSCVIGRAHNLKK